VVAPKTIPWSFGATFEAIIFRSCSLRIVFGSVAAPVGSQRIGSPEHCSVRWWTRRSAEFS
jgi:hypothetical protein